MYDQLYEHLQQNTNNNLYKTFYDDPDVFNINLNIMSVGDNIVGLLSQIGWTENVLHDSPVKVVPMEKIFINVDTNGGNGIAEPVFELYDLFHSKIQHREVVLKQVYLYLQL